MRSLVVAAIAVALFAAGQTWAAQTPTTSIAPENLAAARELVQAMKTADQFKAQVPSLIANIKPVVVQNRPEVGKQYEAMMPTFQQQAMQRVNELTDAIATIYAQNFTVDELHAIATFYGTPAGQKLNEASPTIGSQSVQAIKQFQQAVVDSIKKQMHSN
jgi:uncharacterized protein